VEAHRLVRRRGSHIFYTIASQMAVRWRAGRCLPTGRFLVLTSVKDQIDPRAAGRIRSTEKSNGLIGNWTRDLPDCSTVSQPTTLPRVAIKILFLISRLTLLLQLTGDPRYVCMYIAGEGLNRPQHRDHPWSIVLSPILSPLLVPHFE
jgi:hypothetical protein